MKVFRDINKKSESIVKTNTELMEAEALFSQPDFGIHDELPED